MYGQAQLFTWVPETYTLVLTAVYQTLLVTEPSCQPRVGILYIPVDLSFPAGHLFWSLAGSADIRELIEVDDVMEDDSLRFGPNGGLVFCMEYFANNFDWLENCLGHVEDDYILFDCPGMSKT